METYLDKNSYSARANFMKKLNREEIEFITKCLKENNPLPDSYKYIIPFETKKDYEITYLSKEQ